MKHRILLLLGFSLTTLHAADPVPADLLRQGLFEEEANRNFDKAAEHYRAVINAHERQRALAASATFRLGEVARKQNDKAAAGKAYRELLERFPEQQELCRLSRENLTTLGIKVENTVPQADPQNLQDPETAEIVRLKEIARNSPDLVDGADAKGWRPIHHAAAKGQCRVLSFLLENKSNPNALTQGEGSLTPLHLAAMNGHLGAVKCLINAKTDPNITCNFFRALDEAKPQEHILFIVEAGSRLTALELAMIHDRRETAKALMHAGTNLNHRGALIGQGFDTPSVSPLELAIGLSQNDNAQALLDAGASPNREENNPPITALQLAVMKDNRVAASALLKAGAQVNAKLSDGGTAIHDVDSAEMLDLLMANGADINAKNDKGLTLLDQMFSGDREFGDRGFGNRELRTNPAVIELLHKKGAAIGDPVEFMQRTSESMLPKALNLFIYPKVHRADAILIAYQGAAKLRGKTYVLDPFDPLGGDKIAPSGILPAAIRASQEGSPPSLAEALSKVFDDDTLKPTTVRIVRQNAKQSFESIHEWKAKEDETLPKDWPTLQWGDIVEVVFSWSSSDPASDPFR